MVKRAVIRVAARGYVDGRYIGEEKELIDVGGGDDRRGGRKGRGGKRAGNVGDDIGNKIGGVKRRGGKARGAAGATGAAGTGRTRRAPGDIAPRAPGAGVRQGRGAGRGQPRAAGGPAAGRGNKARGVREPLLNQPFDPNARGNALPMIEGNRADGEQNPRARKNRGGKKTPFRSAVGLSNQQSVSISETAEARRYGDEAKSGQFAEALAREATVKRERLHKALAQSGQGSRRDMEIMITSGRVMVNGIVATIGTSVSAADQVLIDHRPVKLKFNEDLPRVLLYHKPEGEIVSTDDPGNRITVFDNLPRVENGKWVAIGRLDINTSGLLIFTTSGEFANRMMHPRYEVEREYAVRVLGELTDEQTQALRGGIALEKDDVESDEDEAILPPEDEAEFPDDFASDDEGQILAPIAAKPPVSAHVRDGLARFDSIEARGGEGANHWYHVVLREGRNREVRKMFESQGLTVSRLIRVRFGKITLPPRLGRGRMIELDPTQVRTVLNDAGMKVEGPMAGLGGAAKARPDKRGPAKDGRPPRQGARDPVSGVPTDRPPRAPGSGQNEGGPRSEKGERGRGRRGKQRRGVTAGPVGAGEEVRVVPVGNDGIPDFSGIAFDDNAGNAVPAVPAVPAVRAVREGGPPVARGDRPPRRGRGRRNNRSGARVEGIGGGAAGVPGDRGDHSGNRAAGGDEDFGNRAEPGNAAPVVARPPREPRVDGVPREPGTGKGRGRRNFRRGRKPREGGGGGTGGSGPVGGAEPGNSL